MKGFGTPLDATCSMTQATSQTEPFLLEQNLLLVKLWAASLTGSYILLDEVLTRIGKSNTANRFDERIDTTESISRCGFKLAVMSYP
jgi:hypothetical protein